MTKKNAYIHTIGCQMNVHDSERIAGILHRRDYATVDDPELADLIIVNTCAIREKAEQKVFSFLGRLTPLKRKNPELVIAVGGCVAQQEGKKIVSRMPAVDLVFGTQALDRLPENLKKIEKHHRPVVDIGPSDIGAGEREMDILESGSGVSRFVTIMRGCDNYCTYCVVPYVRGREVSRDPDEIVNEVKNLVDAGAREVTLLGQNVNSYGKKEGMCSFPELLYRLDAIEGLLRIRFTTSHPKDLSDALILAFTKIEKLCKHFHLPVQSGSDRILKRMNRGYSRAHYMDRLQRLRDACPGIAVTSDFIAGFPGESENDFNRTLDLIQSVEFDGVFAFEYSDRPNASAARFSEKVAAPEKRKRLQRLLAIQEVITRRKNEALIGTVLDVLVEGQSRRLPVLSDGGTNSSVQWTGRSSGNKIVHFVSEPSLESAMDIRVGQLVDVRIERAMSHSLQGQRVSPAGHLLNRKGESYAA